MIMWLLHSTVVPCNRKLLLRWHKGPAHPTLSASTTSGTLRELRATMAIRGMSLPFAMITALNHSPDLINLFPPLICALQHHFPLWLPYDKLAHCTGPVWSSGGFDVAAEYIAHMETTSRLHHSCRVCAASFSAGGGRDHWLYHQRHPRVAPNGWTARTIPSCRQRMGPP